jgi:hypothetical protein
MKRVSVSKIFWSLSLVSGIELRKLLEFPKWKEYLCYFEVSWITPEFILLRCVRLEWTPERSIVWLKGLSQPDLCGGKKAWDGFRHSCLCDETLIKTLNTKISGEFFGWWAYLIHSRRAWGSLTPWVEENGKCLKLHLSVFHLVDLLYSFNSKKQNKTKNCNCKYNAFLNSISCFSNL